VLEKLKHIKNDKKLSDTYVADSMGITSGKLNKILNGHAVFTFEHFMGIVDALDIPHGQLFEYTDDFMSMWGESGEWNGVIRTSIIDLGNNE